MSSVPRYTPHYTYSDYLQWEGDWELWNGVPVAMTPSPFGAHQLAGARLVAEFGRLLGEMGCRCEVLYEIDWRIADDTIVRPDVVIICGDIPEKHLMEPPVLIVEILSAATEQKDRTVKRDLYARQRVPYYLVVDPNKKTIETLKLSESGIYDPMSGLVIKLDLAANCSIDLNLANLWKP